MVRREYERSRLQIKEKRIIYLHVIMSYSNSSSEDKVVSGEGSSCTEVLWSVVAGADKGLPSGDGCGHGLDGLGKS